ncbi:hypothetical protein GA0115234_100616 [Streptomyces sp. DvalAA-43]|nr:hypothetical protein GA0115234_100616 [Streptomyces sp. DvalAA-43]
MNALDEYGRTCDRHYAPENRILETFGYFCEQLELRDYFFVPQQFSIHLDDLGTPVGHHTGLPRPLPG